jgi:carbon catabolite-derepressing protein kinase
MQLRRYEVITTPTDIIMVMEYAGGELFNFIVERGKVSLQPQNKALYIDSLAVTTITNKYRIQFYQMSEEDARRFFQQIICAVEYCHRHKIAHRDLKPEKYSFLEGRVDIEDN